MKRWVERFNAILNVDRAADLNYISDVPALPQVAVLDDPLTLREWSRQ